MNRTSEPVEQRIVREALAEARFREIRWVAETGSTNDDLAAAAQRGEPEQVLVTDLQTTGRGRRGRVWDAPSTSSVLMSVLVREPRPAEPFWVVGALAVAAAQAASETVTTPCRLKWPNDLVIANAKVAGILAVNTNDAAIVGIGINANWPRKLPPELASATALNHHLALGIDRVDRAALAASTLTRFESLLALDLPQLRDTWREHCSTIGQRVRVIRPEGEVTGVAVDVTPQGALVVDEDSGSTSEHWVGDVVHLRPA